MKSEGIESNDEVGWSRMIRGLRAKKEEEK